MGVSEAMVLTNEARSNVAVAHGFIGAAYVHGAALLISAANALSLAGTLLARAATESSAESPQLSAQLTALSDSANARSGEAKGVALLPWPFIYIGMGFLGAAVARLGNSFPVVPAPSHMLGLSNDRAKTRPLSGEERALLTSLGVPDELLAIG